MLFSIKTHYFCYFFLFIGFFSLSSCGAKRLNKATDFSLQYLDDYVLAKDLIFSKTKVGGLSGIDYDGKTYYTVCDDPRNPRLYKLNISIKGSQIDTVVISDLIQLQKKEDFTKNNHFDLESIFFQPETKNYILSSEGSISRKKDPTIFSIDSIGNYLQHYDIPSYFKAKSSEKPRNNGLFEGLSRSVNQQGFWVASELPIESDGPKTKLYRTRSPVRFTYYNKEETEPIKQFSYLLEPIRRIPFLPFSMNGLSDILEIRKDEFLVIERSFSAGRGNNANSILLFEANATEATNTLEIVGLKGKINTSKKPLAKKKIMPAKKKLVFDFRSVKKLLTQKHIDNIEGITFGPVLKNGNQSLILIADNNFNVYGDQLNQIILMEIIEK